MRGRAIFPFLIIPLFVCGAGCAWITPVSSPRITTPLDQNVLAPIPQIKGFGEIPVVPAPKLKPGMHGTVQIQAPFPDIPPNPTVLRVKSNRPNAIVLQQISNSINLPAGLLGPTPTTHELNLEWNDHRHIRWNASAHERRVDFEDLSVPKTTLTVSSWPDTAPLIEVAIAFLRDHGVSVKGFGPPFINPDWHAWWAAQTAANHCMTASTVAAIRTAAHNGSIAPENFEPLPEISRNTCVAPEFPSFLTVNFSATQDGQAIFSDDGTPQLAASLVIDLPSRRVVHGWLTVNQDPDRSDYPGITSDEAHARMASGGQGGTPVGDVTIADITFEWYRITDQRHPSTTFLYPALVGTGTIRRDNGGLFPYRVVVPLIRNGT